MRTLTPFLLAFPLLARAQECATSEYELTSASTRPATRNCETKGRLVSPQLVTQPFQVEDLNECVSACKTPPFSANCKSFGYTASNSSCAMYTKRLIDMKYKQRATDLGTTFSNSLCYQCKPFVCPNPEAVTNGGFETAQADNSDAPEGWALSYTGVQDQNNFIMRGENSGFGGAAPHVVFYSISDATEQTVSLTQVLDCVQIGAPYLVSFRFGGTATRLAVYLDGQLVFGLDCRFSQSCRRTTTYDNATVFPTTNNPTLEIRITGSVDAEGTLDDVSLKRQTPG